MSGNRHSGDQRLYGEVLVVQPSADDSCSSATGRVGSVEGCRELLQELGSARKGHGASAGQQGPGRI